MKNYLILAAAATMTAPAAHALTVDQTDVQSVGSSPTELTETLNFDGYTGSGTVTEVRLGFRGVIDSNINIVNTGGAMEQFSATTVTAFNYTSPAGTSSFNVAGTTGPGQEITGGGGRSFEVSGDNGVSESYTGSALNAFLSAFSIGLTTETLIQISGGGGNLFGGQSTEGSGEVTVEYLIEDPVVPIPLPATAWMMLAALGSVLAFRRRTNA